MRVDAGLKVSVVVGAIVACGIAVWQGCVIYDSSLLLPAEAGDAANDVVPDAGDGCNHKTWPARPAADDDGGADIEVDLALTTLDFGTSDGGGGPPRLVRYDLA